MINMKKLTGTILLIMMIVVHVIGCAETLPGSGVKETTANTIGIAKTVTVTNTSTEVSKVFGPNITYSFSIVPANVLDTTTVTDNNNVTIHVLPGKMEAVVAQNNGGTQSDGESENDNGTQNDGESENDNGTQNDGETGNNSGTQDDGGNQDTGETQNHVASKEITLSLTSSEVELTTGKGSVTGYAQITFDPKGFGVPGVYRYLITDTTSKETLWSAGILRAEGYKTQYYLDVYTAYKTDENGSVVKTPENLTIQGYAFFDTNENVTSQSAKLGGFIENDSDDVTIGTTAVSPEGDLYPTLNAEITQVVSGNMADPTHPFPVSVVVDNPSGNGQVAVYIKDSQGNISTPAGPTTEYTGTIKDSETFTLIGLNFRASLTPTETNDTSELYHISAKYHDASIPGHDEADIKKGESYTVNKFQLTDWPVSNPEALSISAKIHTDRTVVQFVNRLTSVSPTGIIRYVTPYALMFAFALFFVLFLKRRKEETAE